MALDFYFFLVILSGANAKSKNLISRCFDCAQHDCCFGHLGTSISEVIESLKNGLNCFVKDILSLALQDDSKIFRLRFITAKGNF